MKTITIKSFSDAYVRNDKIYDTEKAKITDRRTQRELQIKRLNNKLNKLHCPSWIDEIVKPIAERLVVAMPDRTFDILGPFGLSCETAVHFYKKGVVDKEKCNGDNCRSITFRPIWPEKGRFELGYVDYDLDTKEFPRGSIAEMNGMNFPTIPLKDTTTMSELLKLVK